MPKCGYCEAEVEKDARKCRACGRKFSVLKSRQKGNWFVRNKSYWITWISVLSISILWGWARVAKYGQLGLTLHYMLIFLLLMGLPLLVFSSVIISVIKFRKSWKKLLITHLVVGFVAYLLISSMFFIQRMQDYDYSINCLNLLQGRANTLESHEYRSCSAYKEHPNQNYVDYLMNVKKGGVAHVFFQTFFTYSLLIIPFWPILILFPILFLFAPT